MPSEAGRTVLTLLLIGVALHGPGVPPQSQESRLAALEASVAQLQETQQLTTNRIDQLRLDLDNTLDPLRARIADTREAVRGLESRLGAIEEQLALTAETLRALNGRLDAGGAGGRPVELGAPMPPPSRPAGLEGPRAVGATESEPAPAPRSEADLLYSTAWADYLAAEYDLAISGFREYLERFADRDRADDALYWIADSLFAQGDHARARGQFLEVERRFPDSDFAPTALLKAAISLHETGATGRALAELAELAERTAGTPTNRLACEQIERLGAEPPGACGTV